MQVSLVRTEYGKQQEWLGCRPRYACRPVVLEWMRGMMMVKACNVESRDA